MRNAINKLDMSSHASCSMPGFFDSRGPATLRTNPSPDVFVVQTRTSQSTIPLTKSTSGGEMRFTTNTPDRWIGSWTANARVRWSGVPFGDQTMFMTREIYDAVGGMPELPIMEDYELSRRLKAVCWPKQLRQKVYTSPRRFESGGNIRVMIQMRHLRHLYRKGVDIETIARLYGEGRHGDRG